MTCGGALTPAHPTRMERKFATALFADLVGSTSLAEREDPEVVQSVVGRAFDRLSEEIVRYEGLLEKFMGDAVLAVFGVRRAHEDDSERAVRAALEMQAILSELNRGFAAEGKPTLRMRIGIEAGEVLVDVERTSGRRDRMLTGDAVNTAARLQTTAEPGQTVIGPTVYASTKDVIEYRELEPLELKGKAEPVPAWQTLRIKARTRGERPRLGMEARLVGRDEELAVLKQTFHRVQTDSRPASASRGSSRSSSITSRVCPRSRTGVGAAAWPTETPRTQPSPMRSKRSARSSTTMPPRSRQGRPRRQSASCSATTASRHSFGPWWAPASRAR